MGQLTTVWGPGVGFFTLANWSFAAAGLCALLDPLFLPGWNGAVGLPDGTMTATDIVLLVQ